MHERKGTEKKRQASAVVIVGMEVSNAYDTLSSVCSCLYTEGMEKRRQNLNIGFCRG